MHYFLRNNFVPFVGGGSDVLIRVSIKPLDALSSQARGSSAAFVDFG